LEAQEESRCARVQKDTHILKETIAHLRFEFEKFSKVSWLVIFYSQLSSELILENFY